nr:ribonuclease H-like domain-containing protein [Tanacetum cinerariifolium]
MDMEVSAIKGNRVTAVKTSAERKNKTLIEAARTMLADSLLPITFWAEVVNTAFYVLNRALVTKTQNKTPYELLNGRTPRLDFVRPFGCPVTILNTLDPLGKFEGKANEGFLDGYSVTSKAFKSSDDKPADDEPKDDTGSKTVEEPVNKEDQAYIIKDVHAQFQGKKALDDALFASMDCLEFEKCNMRLKTDIKPKEATFQVVMDALAFTPCWDLLI